MYLSAFKKLEIPEKLIKEYEDKLVSFAGEQVKTRGYIDLLTTFGDGRQSRTILVRYVIVETSTSYNILIGRPSLNELSAIVSTPIL